MEDDIRAETDKMGFCRKHLKKIYAVENRLGFALVMKTHMDKVINEIEKRNEQPVKAKTLFKKAETPSACDYIKAVSYTHLDVYKRQLTDRLNRQNKGKTVENHKELL